MNDIDVLVTIKYGRTIEIVAAELRAAGLREQQVFKIARVVAGSTASDNFPQLRDVTGVHSVEISPIHYSS